MQQRSVQDEEELEIELTEDEFHYAVEMTEVSIRRLTKAHIIDLRNIVKPHHLVEKVLNMVCILRGSIAPNWTMAREMMNSMTFKLELVLLDASKIKPSLMKRVIKILNNFHRHLTPDVSELVICLNLFPVYCLASGQDQRRSFHTPDLDHQLRQVECRSYQVQIPPACGPAAATRLDRASTVAP